MKTYIERLREINAQSTSLSAVPYREACGLLKEADAEIDRMRRAVSDLQADAARDSEAHARLCADMAWLREEMQMLADCFRGDFTVYHNALDRWEANGWIK